MAKKEVNVSNALTLFRLLIGPVILWMILISENKAAAALFVLALLSDFLDGFLARRYNTVTEFGKFIDPLADKILFGCVLFAILIRYEQTAWIFVFAAAIPVFLVLYLIFAKKKVAVTQFGRACLVLESIVLMLMIYGIFYSWMIILFAVLVAIPAIDYLFKILKVIR